MTLYDYEQKYVKKENTKVAKWGLRFIVAIIGVFFVFCLFSIVMDLYNKNQYVGYGAIAVAVLLFIAFYIVPLIKISQFDAFQVNVNKRTAVNAIKHNRELRHSIAKRMVEITDDVEGVGWYDEEIIGKLAIALENNNDKKIKANLSSLYAGTVKKSANQIIIKNAVRSGMYTALSQSNKVDAALVAVVNLQMIKDIVFLYGFRPSEPRLLKIFSQVLANSLVAYGLEGVSIGNGVVKKLGDMVNSLPILGSAISIVVDSSVQGLANGTLTAVIGYQTIKYLNTEYHLQDILDNVIIEESEEEFNRTCQVIKAELKNSNAK